MIQKIDSVETGDGVSPSDQFKPLQALGVEIHKRVGDLQRRYLANTSSAARALLANLRNGVGKSPGSIPAIWEITVGELPGARRDTSTEATHEERAAHAALTLYAFHQQSRTESMHVRGIGLGHAIDRLAPGASDERPAVRRRFDAVATATNFDEAMHHLRGLVGQLRSARIPLDYGQLADDLVWLQKPATADRVRLSWARQYYRTPSNRPTSDTTEKEAS